MTLQTFQHLGHISNNWIKLHLHCIFFRINLTFFFFFCICKLFFKLDLNKLFQNCIFLNIISNVRLRRVNIFILDSHLNSDVMLPIWDVITTRPFSKTPPFKDMPAKSTSANPNSHNDWQMESVSDYEVLAATLSLLCCLQSLRLSQRQVHIFL